MLHKLCPLFASSYKIHSSAKGSLTRDINGRNEGASPLQAMPLCAVRCHAVVHAQLQDLCSSVQDRSRVSQVCNCEQPAALHRHQRSALSPYIQSSWHSLVVVTSCVSLKYQGGEYLQRAASENALIFHTT